MRFPIYIKSFVSFKTLLKYNFVFVFFFSFPVIGSSLPTDELSEGATAGPGVVSVGETAAAADKEQVVVAAVAPAATAAQASTAVQPQKSSNQQQQPPIGATSAVTPSTTPTGTVTAFKGAIERSPSAVSETSKTGSDMVVSIYQMNVIFLGKNSN